MPALMRPIKKKKKIKQIGLMSASKFVFVQEDAIFFILKKSTFFMITFFSVYDYVT